MKKILSFIISAIYFSSCGSNSNNHTSCSSDPNSPTKRNYTYVMTIKETDYMEKTIIKEKDSKIISAICDTVAYIDAYTDFCISKKVSKDLKKISDYASIPVKFSLYNDKGEDITHITFTTKGTQEAEIYSYIMNRESITSSITKQNKIDSVKIQELLPYFDVTKDEFDPYCTTFYEPKSRPKHIDSNTLYLYFSTQNNNLSSLRFRVQYCDDDWLFIKKIQFSIDGIAYEYIPRNIENDHGSTYIWEWIDDALTNYDKDLIIALANAKDAKIKFIGRHYYDIKTIKPNQIEDIKRSLELYRAMGGNF